MRVIEDHQFPLKDVRPPPPPEGRTSFRGKVGDGVRLRVAFLKQVRLSELLSESRQR